MRISDWSSDVCSSDLLIDGLGRCRLRVRIAAESHAETLPDALRLAIRNMFGTAKGQVLEQVGEAALLFGFEHRADVHPRSEEHSSELQSLMRISYAVFCLKKKKQKHNYIQMPIDSL